jgi:predicted O-linked N-acetylglucosamine transferase (SPINDLY family)
MDFNAINTFLEEAFFSENIPTYVDINHIIDFYKRTIIVSKSLPFSLIELKTLSANIFKIQNDCKELYILYELVFSGLIIHCGRIDDREEFDNYFAQWVWSRYLLNKLETNNTISIDEKKLLYRPSEIKIQIAMSNNMNQLYLTRYLFVQLWNFTVSDIIQIRSNFEKAIIELTLNESQLVNNQLFAPYETLPFWCTQPAFGLTYHNSNNSTLLGLLGKFYKILFQLRYKNISCNLELSQKQKLTNTLKIGFIARTFNNHSVGRITMGLIEKLNEYEDIETYIYTVPFTKDIRTSSDQFAKRIYNASKNYKAILASDLINVITQIRDDKLDAIIIPDSFMDIYTYCIGIYRLAPVQITTWGHPDTSGSPNIDYYITSKLFEKSIDNIYYEKPIFMNSLSFYYYDLENTYGFNPIEMFKTTTRSEHLIDLNLNIPTDAHIYGITSTMFKIHPSFDCIINSILHYDKKAHIIFIQGVHEELFKRVIQRLNITIMNENLNRIIIVPYQTQPYAYEKLLLSCDVILDTFPFGGCISTFDAFSCNKCVVTLPGNKQYGRFTQGLYQHMGFNDLIVKDEDSYVELALKIATYPAIRRSLEKKIADNKYKLYENKEVIDEWYTFLKNTC